MGRHDDAIKQLELAKAVYILLPRGAVRAGVGERTCWDWLFLAMTQHKLRQRDQATISLSIAQNWINQRPDTGQTSLDEPFSSLSWSDQLELRLLERQAAALLQN
jgi:hypothetical protein